jgi:N-acyl-D-amino-acid deacylase
MEMKILSENILISNGTLFTMNHGEEPFKASVSIERGRVSGIFSEPPRPDELPCGTEIFDAEGLYVAPGFIDIHIHDECEDARETVEFSMLRQGVTTALSGNCGLGTLFSESEAIHGKAWINLYTLTGNCFLREEVGHNDRYTPATPDEIEKMKVLLRDSLAAGAMGLSLGLEYAPGATYDEIKALADVAAEFEDRLISVHIRNDDDRCVNATEEVMRLARESGVRLQVSHLGSMTMYNTQTCTDIIADEMKNGLDVGFDCYPYDAFCAQAGSAVYDDGFAERWRGKGPEALEAVSGQFKGQRLTFETLAKMRSEEPTGLIVAHVMDKKEVENCIAHPKCIIASDALYESGGAHPRMLGAFPRGLRVAREHGYNWRDALKKVTSMPADAMKIDAGRLGVGKTADVVVFHPDEYTDNATFDEPFLPPGGVKLVLAGGYPAVRNGMVSREPHGALRKRGK